MGVADSDGPLRALHVENVAPGYRSPYSVRFSTPADQRLAHFAAAPWCDPRAAARVPFDRWYVASTRSRWGSWGPPALRYPVPGGRFRGRLARERVVGVAAPLIGLDYQHHHVPFWSPPTGWPHTPVRSGRRGPGLDCSNYIGFVYSYALGIDLPTGVVAQSALHRSTAEGALRSHRVQVLVPADYDSFVATLQPADVVYVQSDAGPVSHAVLWLGECGVGPSAVPLVIDSGGGGRLDAHRIEIPAGVRIRPYRRTGWYATSTVYAHRIIPD
jgi:hypothetical protein